MRKSFAYFFLTCSLILVLGHSILPHSHVERQMGMCEISESKDLSITEIIKLSLAHNLGSNHLEEFNKLKKSTFTLKVSQKEFIGNKSISIVASNYTIAVEYVLLPEANYQDDYLFTDTQLRAPPSIS